MTSAPLAASKLRRQLHSLHVTRPPRQSGMLTTLFGATRRSTRTLPSSSDQGAALLRSCRRKINKGEIGRRRAAALGAAVTDPLFLQRHTVRPATAAQYLKAADEFLVWTRHRQLSVATQKLRDNAMRQYLIHLFLHGEPAFAARVAMYGYMYKMGLNRRDPLEFPLPRSSLAGYGKAAPEAQRDPCPWEAALLIALELTNSKDQIDLY